MYRRVQSCYIARDTQGGVEVLTEVRAADHDLSKYVANFNVPYPQPRLTLRLLASQTTVCTPRS